LFGAGSEGGTVRFIQTSPSLTDYTAYSRAEVASVTDGDLTYEGGLALGGPIVEDRVGFRASAYYRRDAGYVDGVIGNATLVDPSGALYGDSVAFERTATPRKDTNWASTTGVRAALKFAVTDSFNITPSVSYQKVHLNDGFDTFFLPVSNRNSDDYARMIYVQGDPASDARLNAITGRDKDKGDDEFYLYVLAADWSFGDAQLISNTSYFDRDNLQWFDMTGFYSSLYAGSQIPQAGDKAPSLIENHQENFVQELRLQSTDPDARLKWVVGAFYSDLQQNTAQSIPVNFLLNQPAVGFGPFPAVTGGPPFGGSAFVNWFGQPLLPGSVIFAEQREVVEKQLAGFAQADFRVTDGWTLTAGLRVSRNKVDFLANFPGPENNLNPPFGAPCVSEDDPDGDGICNTLQPGQGVYAPVFASSDGNKAETAVTPKVGVAYELNDDNMFYATVAKGFRPPSISSRVPPGCNGDLVQIGYVDADGNPSHPLTSDSDSVWSYELGTKNRLLDGRMTLDASVYHIKWKNIQTRVVLNTCGGYEFADNLGTATSEGFDLGFQAIVVDGLTVGGSVGYSKVTFDEDTITPGGRVLFPKGSGVPDAGPPWVVTLSGQYDFNLFDGREFYARADYAYSSERRRAGETVPGASNFNPLAVPTESYYVVNARLGMTIGGADVSLFVDNLTESRPYLALISGIGTPAIWQASTLRPRTIGLTVTYRYD
jgi:outer membrane receptor protein involved in Fe transport